MIQDIFLPGVDPFVSKDGKITAITKKESKWLHATVVFQDIHPSFLGFCLPPDRLIFNCKSTLGQLGIHTHLLHLEISRSTQQIIADVKICAFEPLGSYVLSLIEPGIFLGKLFADDDRKIVSDPDVLVKLMQKKERKGNPYFSLGPSNVVHLEMKDHKLIAFLDLLPGKVLYDPDIYHLLPALFKGLKTEKFSSRPLIKLFQIHDPSLARTVETGQITLVQTHPLSLSCLYAQVATSFLPPQLFHSSSLILDPQTIDSGDIYELFTQSSSSIDQIPLQFYTLHPYQTPTYFSIQPELSAALANPQTLRQAFSTAPQDAHTASTTLITSQKQLEQLNTTDWITSSSTPFIPDQTQMSLAIDRLPHAYIEKQSSYFFLKALQDEHIVSEGALLSQFFPSPLLRPYLLSAPVCSKLKQIYFQYPSRAHGPFFSEEDRSLLWDLSLFGIETYWLEPGKNILMQYLTKPGKRLGMFVPLKWKEVFLQSTFFGVYGSNLMTPNIKQEMLDLFTGLLRLKQISNHDLFHPRTSLAIVSGGGPGVMRLANQTAQELGILSCANIVDFSQNKQLYHQEQEINPYIDAKMTYRLENLIERQSGFHLDFPIFMMGGIGTDFEYALEEVRRKVGSVLLTPILLFGDPNYWRAKISSRFACNVSSGTIYGSEWISNCFFCVQNHKQALEVYQKFFKGNLQIGPQGKIYPEGFVLYS